MRRVPYRLAVRLTLDERAALTRAAELDGSTLSDYVRTAALTHAHLDLEHGARAATEILRADVDEELVLAARDWLENGVGTHGRIGSRLAAALRALLRRVPDAAE